MLGIVLKRTFLNTFLITLNDGYERWQCWWILAMMCDVCIELWRLLTQMKMDGSRWLVARFFLDLAIGCWRWYPRRALLTSVSGNWCIAASSSTYSNQHRKQNNDVIIAYKIYTHASTSCSSNNVRYKGYCPLYTLWCNQPSISFDQLLEQWNQFV